MTVDAPPLDVDGVPDWPADKATEGLPGAAKRASWRRWSRPAGHPGVLAVLTWLLATPVAFVLPGLIGKSPFTVAGWALPISGGLLLVCFGVLVAAAVRRWAPAAMEALAGVSAGLAAAWLVLVLRAALHGTPFGFGGLGGDMLRMSAAATRYTVTITSSDTTVPELPSEYPPLYSWLVGRAAVLLDQPAWRTLGDAEVLFISASLLAGFLLWRRQVGAWAALAVSCVAVLAWSDPRKAYEVMALMIFIPWVVETFTRPPRERLHWLTAGLLGGLMVVLYQAWLVYAVLGLMVLIVLAWRAEPDRLAYLRRLALVATVATVTSSWYVLPYLWALFTDGGGQLVSDLYASPYYLHGLLPFLGLQAGDQSDLLLRGLQAVGMIGLVWLLRSAWWARPLLLIAAAAFAYRLLSLVRFMLTGHTGFAHYTLRLYGVVLAIAGVLTLVHVVPLLLRRLRLAPPVGLVGVPLAILLAWGVTSYTAAWMPPANGAGSSYATAAHTEPLPGGGYPRFAPDSGRVDWFPVEPVRQAVEDATGPDPDRVTLSVDERLFSYLPWPGYLSNDRTAGGTLSRWDERQSELLKLSEQRDPAAFAAESGATAFGPIDVFVLTRSGDELIWEDLRFHREQFDERYWVIREDLPEQVAVYVRR
ncbi:arabinofuranosyltransferase [Micromonospora sp. NBC_01813]|uniref:arabinofuranosyltransferase n=1 Tax=Micromonospora sp. NBC_01813 TaxID=2975988 RepID=UPI002DDC74D7|nr:arabinofuranosyltransferase [Micromonospora sp. NBC_01813]WSA08049.1 arabinofuranosyltransferase [Micromonospora sp. NBC_01813]